LVLLSCALFLWTGVAGPISAGTFWTGAEKWQTLIAALIALAAAIVAILPVIRQLAEQRRQSAAAAVMVITASAESLERERTIVRKMRDRLTDLDQLIAEYDVNSRHQIYVSWPDDAHSIIRKCDRAMRKLMTHSERNSAPSLTQNLRTAALDALFHLRNGLTDLVTIMRQETSGLSYEDGENDIPEDEHQLRRDHVDQLREERRSAANRLEEALSTEIETVWRRIRQLEKIAIGVES